ncbi:MAG TPA: Rieske 2Fe-2S domain-containing protein [Micromonosporaceae bacterium]
MYRLAAVSDLEELQPVVVTLDGRDIAVVRIRGDVHAFSATCSHRAAPLVDGAVTWKHTILCPWHLGTFNLRTGAAMAGPPHEPIPIYPIAIVDGVVYLDAEPESLPMFEHRFPHAVAVGDRTDSTRAT